MALLLFVGMLLVQGAWMLSVPAFRGPDEFDHAYRAAAVAGGQWLSSGVQAPHGRGQLVTVPPDLVRAAGPECRALPYTGHDNCAAQSSVPGGDVRVASGASRYNPLYYWVVGQAGALGSGTSALEAMRALSAVLCAALVALTGWTLSCWARSRWPLAALLVCLTPVVLYSSVVVAPNALEILAALSVWVALAGLLRPDVDPALERTLLVATLPGALVLVTVRTLGPGWLALTLLVVAGCLGARRTRSLLRRHGRLVLWWTVAVGVATVTAVAWILVQAPLGLEEDGHYPHPVVGSLIQLPVWVLQSIAAAPGRRNPAPGLVYLAALPAIVGLLVAGYRQAPRRARLLMLAVGIASLAAPLVITLDTYTRVGVIWQGRYGLPLTLGLVVLAGAHLDVSARVRRRTVVLAVTALALFDLAQVGEVVHVASLEARTSPSLAAGLWTAPPSWLVVTLMLGGLLAMAATLVPTTGPLRSTAHPPVVLADSTVAP